MQQLSSSHLQYFRLYICNPERDIAAAYVYISGRDEISKNSFIIKLERINQVETNKTFTDNLVEFLIV